MKKILHLLLLFATLSLIISSCKKTNPDTDNTHAVPIDADGNIYDTVRINDQVWMKENLKTAHYRDGSPITSVNDSAAWANIYNNHTRTPAWSYPARNSANDLTYGKLYNWYVVNDPRGVCPVGWHVPDSTEFMDFLDYTESIGNYYEGGGHAKDTTFWHTPNVGATNATGFSALGAGTVYLDGRVLEFEVAGTFWVITDCDDSAAYWKFRSKRPPDSVLN